MSLWAEIKRRNVFKVGVAYLAFAWLIVQIASIVLPTFELPRLFMRGLIFALALGFPIVLVCAWVYELTPEGLKRTEDVPEEARRRFHAGRKLDFVIIGVLSLALVTVVVDRYLSDADSAHESIAVLPFQNLAEDSDEDYFADGMTAALIANLAKIESINVISRTSAMRFKGTNLSLPEIASQLGANVIVEASAQRVGEHVRIIAQLVDGATDQDLWAETFDRDIVDVLALQSDIAQEIASQIRATVTPEERERLAASTPVKPAAYDAYLKGMEHLYQVTPAELDLAEEYFEEALMHDADSALALAGLGLTWVARAQDQIVPPRLAAPLARGYAERAELLRGESPAVHFVLGATAWLEGNVAESETHMRRAAELEPSYADARAGLANIFMIRGEYSLAVEQMRAAVGLDPLNPFLRNVLATALMGARNCDESITVLRETRDRFPNLPAGLPVLTACLHATGQFDEALSAEREWLRLTRNVQGVTALDEGVAESGYADAMRKVADVLAQQSNAIGAGSVNVAVHYGRAGDPEKTVEWLERAFEQGEPGLRNDLRLPMFDLVRDDSRVQDLMKQLGI
jgi:adenylate cyclase